MSDAMTVTVDGLVLLATACTKQVRLSFKCDPNPSLEKANPDGGIAAAKILILLGVFALGMYPISLDDSSLTRDTVCFYCVPSSLNFHLLLPSWCPISKTMRNEFM